MTRPLAVSALALAVLAVASACSSGSEPTVRVLAASSLTDVFEELAGGFEAARPDVDVELQFAGSSRLASLVVEGAPGDVFASADLATMARVVDSGEAGAAPEIFATNSLTLVVPAGNPAGVEDLTDLADRDLLVAQCAVDVPCGSAAASLYASLGLAVDADSFEPSVRAVLTKVELGEVDVGVVYVTDALAAADRVAEIPIDPGRVANEYAIVTLDGAPTEAEAFVDYVLSAEARAALARYGFGGP